MAKLVLTDLANLINDTTAVANINANSAAIRAAFDNTLSLDGTSPNQMNTDFDMNSRQILNLPVPATAASPLRLQDLNSFIGGGTVTNIPSGGTTGQVLSKTSNTNYLVGWSSNLITVAGHVIPLGGSTTLSASDFTNGTTGTGSIVLSTSPVFISPALGTPSSGVATNLTGTAAGLTAGNVTTNANLTGPITSVGNTTSIASQTGTGSTFVMSVSPTITTPVIAQVYGGTLAGSSLTLSATSNGTPVGDTVNVVAHNINLSSPGGTTINMGSAGSSGVSLVLAGGTSGSTTLNPASVASGVLTLPAATDTLVGRATTDTLSNKTFVAPVLGTPASGILTNCTGLPATSLTGTIQAAQVPAYTGDVTSVAGNLGLTLSGGNAGNLNSGTLLAARLPALTGDVTSTVGTANTTVTKINGVDQTVGWTAYTPTITSGSGTPTTVSATGRYKQIGKTIFVSATVTITTPGTAAGVIYISLPINASTSGSYIGTAYEHVTTGNTGAAAIIGPANATRIQCAQYNGTTFWVANYIVDISVTYEAA